MKANSSGLLDLYLGHTMRSAEQSAMFDPPEPLDEFDLTFDR